MCIKNPQKIVYGLCHLFSGAEKLGENEISGFLNIVQVKKMLLGHYIQKCTICKVIFVDL